jgi:hypothetical protein
MGADLYIRKQYEVVKDKYEPKFDEAVAKRNKTTDKKKEDKYQKEVEKYYDLMNSEGYYRDSYNDSNLLWKLGLDYWGWINDMLNKNGELTPTKAKIILKKVEIRKKRLNDITNKKEREYFESKYKEFVKFLGEAIETKSNIECSI